MQGVLSNEHSRSRRFSVAHALQSHKHPGAIHGEDCGNTHGKNLEAKLLNAMTFAAQAFTKMVVLQRLRTKEI